MSTWHCHLPEFTPDTPFCAPFGPWGFQHHIRGIVEGRGGPDSAAGGGTLGYEDVLKIWCRPCVLSLAACPLNTGFVSAHLTEENMKLEFHHLESTKVAYTAIIPRVAP